MPTQEKVDRVAELKDKLERSSIVVSTGYTGMNANQMVDLRRRMRDGGVEFVVIKNNLLHLAADAGRGAAAQGHHHRPDGHCSGLRRRGAHRQGGERRGQRQRRRAVHSRRGDRPRRRAMQPFEVSRLAALPPRPVLVAQLLGNMQSPLYGLMSVLNGTIRSLAYVLQARMEQMQPAEAAE